MLQNNFFEIVLKVISAKRKERFNQVIIGIIFCYILILLSGCAASHVVTEEGEGYRVLSRNASTGAYAGKCSNCGRRVKGGPLRCPYCGVNFSNAYREYKVIDRVEITTQDPQQLADIAIKCDNGWVGSAAIVNLSDEDLLKKIALETRNKICRRYSVYLIKDIEFLKKIVADYPNAQVSNNAVKMIDDENFLKQYVLNESIPLIYRTTAVKKIKDQAFLRKIIKPDAVKYKTPKGAGQFLKSQLAEYRSAAVKNITDQNVLSHIARNDATLSVRVAAIFSLTATETLKNIAKKDSSEAIRQWASERLSILEIERIKDQDTLKKIALSKNTRKVRASAMKRIEDQKFLIEYFKKRVWAWQVLEIIKDQNFLKSVLSNKQNENNNIRRYAAKNINDPLILKKLILNDRDWIIRDQAFYNLGCIVHGKLESKSN